MKIQVTREHIDKGIKGHACKCPVALALHAAGFKDAMVWYTRICLEYTPPPYTPRNLTDSLVKFLRTFDKGQTVEPFEFDTDDLKEREPRAA